MAVVKTQRVRIQQELVQLGKAGTFPVVSYNPATGEPTDIDDAVVQAPASVLANEVAVSVSPDLPMGRRRVRRRETWTFELVLDFNCEVSLELFENSLLDRVHLIKRDAPNGLAQVELFWTRTEVSHPVQQQPSAGTSARLFFEASIGRS